MALLAYALLGLFLLVLLRQSVGGGIEAVRGAFFTHLTVARVQPVADHPDPLLLAAVEQTATLPGGQVSVAIRDLERGATAAIDATARRPAASLFKLPILVETLKQVKLKHLSIDRPLEITPDAWTDGSGVLQARVGDRLPVSELLRLMIQQSDNIAARVLLNAVGVQATNDDMAALGLTDTVLYDHRAGDDTPHSTSAADMERLLRLIATGQLIDAETSGQALSLLEMKQANNWLGADLPWWVKTAHKWGELPDSANDAGIIFSPSGTYVMVVLTQGGRRDAAQRVITQTASAAYRQLKG